MTIEDIRQVNNSTPFHPYELHRSDGKVAHVDHPDVIAFSPLGGTVIVYRRDGIAETIAVRQIVALHHALAQEPVN